ncbi:MAG: tRNA 2-thiouridine(34) synthase MnmA [Elusimicrobiaceae bacterium]|nr:tRNA 2-thiouridine(34) synthase MnmA [Elusimicrobiaceae bacterium]
MTRKVAVGLDGGLKSALAVELLRRQGYEPVCVTMAVFDPEAAAAQTFHGGCFTCREREKLAAISALAGRLGATHSVIELKDEYRAHVLDYFRGEHLLGRAPGPCVECNRHVKFGVFMERALEAAGADLFATGHCARIGRDGKGGFTLCAGADVLRDQSYNLWRLAPEQFSTILFPVGELTAAQVRGLARECGLSDLAENAQEQSFVPQDECPGLYEPGDIAPGSVVDRRGRVVGRHKGIVCYSVGQRFGIVAQCGPEPVFVSEIEPDRNVLVVEGRQALLSDAFMADEVRWLLGWGIDSPSEFEVKIRVRHAPAPATVSPIAEGRVLVRFANPQLAVAPGQSAVFYRDGVVWGGGVIA